MDLVWKMGPQSGHEKDVAAPAIRPFLNPVTGLPWAPQDPRRTAPTKELREKRETAKRKTKTALMAVKAKMRTILRQADIEKLLLQYPEARKYQVRAALSLAKFDYQKAVLLLEVDNYYGRVTSCVDGPLQLNFTVSCNVSNAICATMDECPENNPAARVGVVIAKGENGLRAELL